MDCRLQKTQNSPRTFSKLLRRLISSSKQKSPYYLRLYKSTGCVYYSKSISTSFVLKCLQWKAITRSVYDFFLAFQLLIFPLLKNLKQFSFLCCSLLKMNPEYFSTFEILHLWTFQPQSIVTSKQTDILLTVFYYIPFNSFFTSCHNLFTIALC